MAIGGYLIYICGLIDSVIIWLLKVVFDLFYKLTDVMLYSENIIQTLGQRIGLVLGIFMLFRLAISMVSYLISPDKLNDTAKGGGKLLINVVVSLVLLATVNIIFVQAYKIQGVVINSKFIEKIFFGSAAGVEDLDISYHLYTPLFSPNHDVFGNVCDEMWDASKKLEDMPECDSKLHELLGDDRRAIYQARNDQDMSHVLSNYNIVSAKVNNSYVFNYRFIVSTGAGIVCGLLLISFAMDLAVRAVKLLFLQIVAPIPIISNIDPGKGQDMFKKWYMECIKTYLAVFVRMLSIDFAVFLITILLANFKDIFSSQPALVVALIIGCLIFAKQIPTLIEEIFGIKASGAFALNPLKKFEDEALLGKNVVGLGRGAVSGITGGISGGAGAAVASAKQGGSFLQGIGALSSGALSGAASSFGAGYKSKTGLEALKAGTNSWATQADRINALDGTTFGGRISAGLAQRLHISTAADRTKAEIDDLNSFAQASDSALKRAEGEMIKYNDLTLADGTSIADFKAEQQRLQMLQNNGVNRNDYATDAQYDNAVSQHARELADLQDKIAKQQKEFATEYITQVDSRSLRDYNGNIVVDGELDNYINQIEHYQGQLSTNWGKEYDIYQKDASGNIVVDASGRKLISGSSVKKSRQDSVVDRQAIENNFDSKGVNVYQRQKANAAATKPKGR